MGIYSLQNLPLSLLQLSGKPEMWEVSIGLNLLKNNELPGLIPYINTY